MRSTVTALFGLDVRSLAACRIGLALYLLYDLARRAPDLAAHYTDEGIIPRRFLWGDDGWSASLHLVSGTEAWQAVLFAAAACAAVALLLGVRTRMATVASWLLLASLHNRAPMLLHNGDVLVRMLLFWSMFLPLGAAWASDARRRAARTPRTVVSVATTALILQVCAMYVATGVYKLDPAFLSGTALTNALETERLARPAAAYLLAWPGLVRALALATVALEIVGPLLLFVPWRTGLFRCLVIAAFLVFHWIGIQPFLNVGELPVAATIGWLALVPGSVWDRVGGRSRPGTEGVLAAERKTAGAATPSPAGMLGQAVAALVLAYVLVWNVRAVSHGATSAILWSPSPPGDPTLSSPVDRVAFRLGLLQAWDMMAAAPRETAWWVVVGRRHDGTEVDLFRDRSPLSFAKPVRIRDDFPSSRWLKLFERLRGPLLPGYAHHLCTRWNASHPLPYRLAQVEIYRLSSPDLAGQIAEGGRLWTERCAPGPRPSFLVFVMDTTRADAVSAYGAATATTPVFDRLAEEGILYEHAYANASWTLPSHATLFTGVPPAVHRAGLERWWLADELETLAERLAAHGYETAGFSENDFVGPMSNLAQGFETFEVRTPADGGVAARAAAWLGARRDDRPLLLFVNVMDAHFPYEPHGAGDGGPGDPAGGEIPTSIRALDPLCGRAPDRERIRRLRTLYLGDVRAADAKLGEVHRAWRAAGAGPLVTIVTADHGEHFGEHGLMGHLFSLATPLLHVPLLVHGLPHAPPARVATPVQLADVAPTLLAWAGVARTTPTLPIDDRDAAATPALRPIVAEYVDVERSAMGAAPRFFAGPQQMVHAAREHCPEDDPIFADRRAVIRFPYKLTQVAGHADQLHDIGSDPLEQNDLAAARPATVAELARLLETAATAPPAQPVVAPALSAEVRERLRTLGYLDFRPRD